MNAANNTNNILHIEIEDAPEALAESWEFIGNDDGDDAEIFLWEAHDADWA